MAENKNAVETLTPEAPVVSSTRKMPKSKKATFIMFACIIVFVALFIILFNVGGGIKGQWDTARIELAEAQLFHEDDKIVILQGQVDGLVAAYRVCSIGSYISSLLALISLGVGLAKSEKYKTQEEEAAEAM